MFSKGDKIILHCPLYLAAQTYITVLNTHFRISCIAMADLCHSKEQYCAVLLSSTLSAYNPQHQGKHESSAFCLYSWSLVELNETSETL